MSRIFRNQANDVEISCKASQRLCAQLAARLAKAKTPTPDEFERVEKMKQIVINTSNANEQMLALLDYMKELLLAIGEDADALLNAAALRNRLEIQSETLEILFEQTTKIEDLKNALRERHKANS